MQAVNYVIRSDASNIEKGETEAAEPLTRIGLSGGAEVSLNVRQSDVQGFARLGSDLEILLVDGRVILLENYFAEGADAPRLFVSADGYLSEVTLVEGADSALYAQYGPTEQWGKCSPSDDLIFLGDSQVVDPALYDTSEVSMLGAGLLGGGNWLGAGAAIGGAAFIGGGGSGGPIVPTVDTDPVVIAGDDAAAADPSIGVTGTGAPGSEVVVTIGDQTKTTTIEGDGTWAVDLAGDAFPPDGDDQTDVVVTDANGTITSLDGPEVFIDLTPPTLEFTDGPASIGDYTNATDHADGVEIAGTGEAGASVVVEVNGESHETTVAEDGTWAIVVDTSVLEPGEYEAEITVTTTDSYGNSAVFVDTVVIDTVPNAITIDTETFEGDGVMNMVEHQDGITVTGTSVPGETVSVTLGGATLLATVDANGMWSATFPTETLAPGEYEAEVSVSSTDAVGNVNTVTEMVRVDTDAMVTISDAPITADNVVNASERAVSGITLTGTTEPGSSVEVSLGGGATKRLAQLDGGLGAVSRLAEVDASGNWTVTFTPSEVPTGETVATVTVQATDAAGNRSTATGEVQIDTEVRNFAMTGTPGGADGVVNADEAEAGLTVTGTTEPGSTVMVQMGQANLPAQVDASGNWTVTIPQDQITRGEYTATMTVTTTDAAGNVATLSEQVEIDTEAGILTLSQAPIEGDNVINHDESLDGVVIRGTSDPGAVVQVSLGDVTHSTVTDDAGNWERLFTRGEIPADTDSAPIVATTTDAAGNTRRVTGSVGVDTVVENHSLDAGRIGGDGVINGVEQQGVVEVTGTVEPGSTVNVNIGGVSRTADVQADGAWTASFLPGSLSTGEDTLPVIVSSTDRHGNRDELRDTVQLDTLVNRLDSTGDPTGGDGVVNLAEAQAGLSLNGQVEPGSTVLVTVAGMAHEAGVTTDGTWSIDLPGDAIPAGLDSVDVEIEATDPAGNIAALTQTLALDLEAPEAPLIEDYTRNLNGYSAISVDLTDNDLAVYEVNQGVPGGQVGGDGVPVDVFGIEAFRFTPEIPDGSHLVVHSTDAAGNSSGTYLVLDELTNADVDLSHAGLGAFNIEAVDLQFAEDSNLTITEAQITALSSNTDTLVVSGGADDTVTIRGASTTGQTRVIENQTYQVYSLGDATVVVDDDINTVI